MLCYKYLHGKLSGSEESSYLNIGITVTTLSIGTLISRKIAYFQQSVILSMVFGKTVWFFIDLTTLTLYPKISPAWFIF